jgi:hypothetical protein
MILRLFSPILLLALFSACSGPDTPTKSRGFVQEVIFPDSTGYFRGMQTGANPTEILESESWIPEISTDTLIVFEESFEELHPGFETHVYLAFDAFGLFEVQADIFAPDSAAFDTTYTAISGKLTKAFGKPDQLGAQTQRWTTNSETNNIVEITLSDENLDGSRLISLNYLEPLDDEF